MSKKPLSARKLAANQANAKKSKGPKTPEGKARSRLNAFKHGLRATDVVLPNDPTESPEEFDELRDALFNDIQPTNMIEKLIVERLAVSHWRLRRVYRHEARATYDERVRQETDPVKNLTRDMGLGHGADLPVQLPPVYNLNLMIRYESSLNRTINQLMNQLIQLRTSRSPLFPTANDIADQTQTTNIPADPPSSPNPIPEPRTPIPAPLASPHLASHSSIPVPPSSPPASSPTPESRIPHPANRIPSPAPHSSFLVPPSSPPAASPNPEPRSPNPVPPSSPPASSPHPESRTPILEPRSSPIARTMWRPEREQMARSKDQALGPEILNGMEAVDARIGQRQINSALPPTAAADAVHDGRVY